MVCRVFMLTRFIEGLLSSPAWIKMIALSVQGITVRRIYSDGREEHRDDVVAKDVPVCLFVNGEPYRTLIASPGMLEELAVGHFYTEAVISSLEDIVELAVKPNRVDVTLDREIDLLETQMATYRLLTTACGAATQKSSVSGLKWVAPGDGFDPSLIRTLVKALNDRSSVFKETGGTHSALLHSETMEVFAEDVGRHNALDKVIGAGLLNGVDFSGCVLGSSGRLAGEMVLKAAKASIPLVFSVSAPLLSGIRVAEEAGITLIGFVRGNRMNVYTRSH
jgi:FdhD protein